MNHRILLVREWDAQTSGSGCCGRLGGETNYLGDEQTFAHNRCEMEAMGELYRALRARWPRDDVDLQVVDPRNMIWLAPTIVRDGRKRKLPWGELLRQLVRGISYNSVIVDGKVLFSGRVPSPDEAIARVSRELEPAR